MTEMAKGSIKAGFGGAGAALATQGAASASIPLLQATFGTIVSGVGTLQPWWIGPLVQFSVAPVTTLAGPAGLGASGCYFAWKGYQAYRNLV